MQCNESQPAVGLYMYVYSGRNCVLFLSGITREKKKRMGKKNVPAGLFLIFDTGRCTYRGTE